MPTPEQDAALASAADAKFAADAALNIALSPYQSLESLPAGSYALAAGSHALLVKDADGHIGVDRIPLLSEALKGAGL